MSVAANSRHQADSSLSIPIYEGSMVSVRSQTAASNGIVRYKSAVSAMNPAKPVKAEIRWKTGKLDKKYQCNACNSYLKCPVQFQDCGHRVCSTCLTDLLKQSPNCPTCNSPISRDKLFQDNDLQREIHNLPVYCSNKPNGCDWEGIFKNHLVHSEDCEFGLVECNRGCGLRYMKKNEKKHLAEECLKTNAVCEFCRTRINKADEVEHLNVCEKFLVPCPDNCGIRPIERGKMADHLENDCTKHQISCPFADCNCQFKSLRTDMTKHLKDSPGIHLNLMCKTLSLQKKQMQLLSEIIDKQKDQITALSNKASTLDKFYGSQLIWKIDNYSEKFNESKMGKKPTIFSPPFLTSRHGYKLALSTALYGDGKAKGKFMSLFLCICKGEFDSLLSWPFSHKITVTLLDQCEDISARRHVSYTIKPNTCKENSPFLGRPTGERNASFGAQKFVELDVLSSLDYVVDDTIFIKVEIDSDEMVLL